MRRLDGPSIAGSFIRAAFFWSGADRLPALRASGGSARADASASASPAAVPTTTAAPSYFRSGGSYAAFSSAPWEMFRAAGNRMVTVVPRPTSLPISIVPW